MLLDEDRNDWDEAKGWIFFAFHSILATNLFPLSIVKFIFLIPYFAFIFLFSINFRCILLAWIFSLLICLLQTFPALNVKRTYLIHLNSLFDLNGYVCGLLNDFYPGNVSEFIKALVFGKKGELYGDFLELGIVHLISVSGFHISFLIRLFGGFVPKKILLFPIIFVYWYSIGFTIAALRPILMFFIKSENKYKSWAMSVCASPLFNVFMFSRISFFLSFMFPLLFAINGDFFKSKLSASIMNFWSAFLYSSLVLLPFSGKLYIYAPMNTIIFFGIIPALFVYFFLSWPFKFMLSIHRFILDCFSWFHESLWMNRNYLAINFWNLDATLIFLCIVLLVFLFKKYRSSNA